MDPFCFSDNIVSQQIVTRDPALPPVRKKSSWGAPPDCVFYGSGRAHGPKGYISRS
jgi:hypothetical protein